VSELHLKDRGAPMMTSFCTHNAHRAPLR
jgi:hypothetical protein